MAKKPERKKTPIQEIASDKRKLFLDLYCSNGFDRSKAYDEVYGSGGTYHSKATKMYNMINRPESQLYIKQRQADLRRKIDIDRATQIAFLEDIKQNCKLKKPIAAIDAVKVQNQMLGWDKPETITEEISIEKSADREFKVTIVVPKNKDAE